MENVVPIRKDPSYKWWIAKLTKAGYDIEAKTISYAAFGAATTRRRLITVGFRDRPGAASSFFDRLKRRQRRATSPRTVRQAIEWLARKQKGAVKDHVWPTLNTISKYEEYYRTGKYGWYQLHYDEPARSFGNIMKTYILHPEARKNGFPTRVLSVREVMCIMGFPRTFAFPKDMGMADRYQAIADAVSPTFSRACSRVLREMLASDK